MRRPIPQEIYRHFKGKLYQIVTIAQHSETGEELVVYQALYGDFKVYCRPLDMFTSKVDRTKYPDVAQEYRFELVSSLPEKDDKISQENDLSCDKKTGTPDVDRVAEVSQSVRQPDISKTASVDSISEDVVYDNTDKSIEEEAETLNLHPLVIKFLDAGETADRLSILSQMSQIITNDMIDIMAMAIDVQIDEGDVYQRFDDLKTCLVMKQRYEATRL